MFKTHFNNQYSLIAEGDFATTLVKKPKYEQTTRYFGTKEDAIHQGVFKNGSNSFFFINGLDTPIINGYMSQLASQTKIEVKTGALTKKQWEELKEYIDSLYKN